MELFQDAAIWVLLSFIVFCFVMWRFAKDSFLAMLDKRIDEIKKELETAEHLRVEAQELLAQYQRKQRDSAKESEQIVESAKKHAIEIQKSAEAELKEIAKRREIQHKERLQRMEEAAIQEIRVYAAELAVQATKEIISNQLDEENNSRLVNASIKSVSKQLAA